MPQNAIAWLMMSAVVFSIWCGVWRRKAELPNVVYSSITVWFAIAAFILCIPLLYAPDAFRDMGLWRVSGVIGGLVFYFSLLQVSFTSRVQTGIICAVIIAVVIQVSIAELQRSFDGLNIYPSNLGRAHGVFQQPNLLASFIAVGYALVWMAFTLPEFISTTRLTEVWRKRIFLFLALCFAYSLVMQQSRTGWLSGILVLVFCTTFLRKHHSLASIKVIIWSVIGVGTAIFRLLTTDSTIIGHDGSNHSRLAMLRISWELIKQKPWFGSGYGSFEPAFSEMQIIFSPTITEVVRHPHNELLLWLVEGGAVAGIGLVILLIGMVKLYARAWNQHKLVSDYHLRSLISEGRHYSGSKGLMLCVATIPLLVHSLTEYPFYASTPHWVIFLFLMAITDMSLMKNDKKYRLNPQCTFIAGISFPLLSIVAITMMIGCLYGNAIITRVEKEKLSDIRKIEHLSWLGKWAFEDRIAFDIQTNGLMKFNKSPNSRLLNAYVVWAEDYMSRRVDRNVYANLISIYRYRNDYKKAEQLRHQATLRFPDDIRFKLLQ